MTHTLTLNKEDISIAACVFIHGIPVHWWLPAMLERACKPNSTQLGFDGFRKTTLLPSDDIPGEQRLIATLHTASFQLNERLLYRIFSCYASRVLNLNAKNALYIGLERLYFSFQYTSWTPTQVLNKKLVYGTHACASSSVHFLVCGITCSE